MGAYGSPDLRPLSAAREPRHTAVASRRSLPLRLILWSLAAIAVSAAVLVAGTVVLALVMVATGHVPPPTAGR